MPESEHALPVLSGMVHEPIAVVGDAVTSNTVPLTNSGNVAAAGNVTSILLFAAADIPPVEEATKSSTYCVRAPAAFDGDVFDRVTPLTACAATTVNPAEHPLSDVVSTLTLYAAGASTLVTPRNTTWTLSPAAIAFVPASEHALARLAGIVHDPIAVDADFVTSNTVPETNWSNVVPLGKLTLIWLLAAADSPPVDDAVKFRMYCVRAPAAAVGDVLSSVTALTPCDATTANPAEFTGSASAVVLTPTALAVPVARGFVMPRNTTWTLSPAAIVFVPASEHALAGVLALGIVHEPIAVAGAFVTSKTVPETNPVNASPLGNVTLMRAFEPASAPVADVLKVRMYCVRASDAFVGEVLSSCGLTTLLASAGAAPSTSAVTIAARVTNTRTSIGRH